MSLDSMLNERLSWLSRAGVIHTKPEYVGRRRLLEAGEELRFRLEKLIEEERGQLYSSVVAQSVARYARSELSPELPFS